MLKELIIKFLHTQGYRKVPLEYPNKYSILNSNEFVLEEKVNKESVLEVIDLLRPINPGIDLIRLGSEADGGYLIPDDLEGIEACFSPGVSSESSFERDCSEKGMKLHLADASVDSAQLEIEHEFIKKFLASYNSDDFISLETWVSDRYPNQSDLLLQMDIEGSEYECILNCNTDLLNRFRIILIEFHDLHKLWHASMNPLIRQVFNKLLLNHSCVHIHPNNCCGIEIRDGIEIPRVMEFTFLRNDRISKASNRTDFPHKLDFDNVNLPHLKLPPIWFKNDLV